MKENSYYKFYLNYGNNKIYYYIKYNCLIDNQIYVFYYIENGKYYDNLNTIDFCRFHIDLQKLMEEIDICEIINFLPRNHPDRIRFRNKRIKIILA